MTGVRAVLTSRLGLLVMMPWSPLTTAVSRFSFGAEGIVRVLLMRPIPSTVTDTEPPVTLAPPVSTWAVPAALGASLA